MDFSPYDGFCCPFVDRLTGNSYSDPRIAHFMSWVKSLPYKSEIPKRYAPISNVVPLKDQPFVIKIVEEGYAYMFHGAFAPKEGDVTIRGFDRVAYFNLITSNFEELKFKGRFSEVVTCDRHQKRFLLELYVKRQLTLDPSPNELGVLENRLKRLGGDFGKDTGSVTMTLGAPEPVANVEEDELQKAVLVSPKLSPRRHGICQTEGQESALETDHETWEWF